MGLGAPAEYGGFTGAVVNTVTKSGGNKWGALFDFTCSNASLGSNNVRAKAAIKIPVARRPREDGQAPRHHPVLRSADPGQAVLLRERPALPVQPEPLRPERPATEVSPRVNGKLTWQPSANDFIAPRPVRRVQHHRPERLRRRLLHRRPERERRRAGDRVRPQVAAPLRTEDLPRGEVHGLRRLLRPQPRGQHRRPLRRRDRGLQRRGRLHRLLRPHPQPGQRLDLALRRGLRPARPQVRRRDRAQQDARPVAAGPEPPGVYYYDYGGPYLAYGYGYDIRPTTAASRLRPGRLARQRPPHPEPGPARRLHPRLRRPRRPEVYGSRPARPGSGPPST